MSVREKDIVILVADKSMQFAIEGLLSRPQRLGIREITYDIFVHPERDAGCRGEAHNFIKPFSAKYDFALVMFDLEGCGKEKLSRVQLEDSINSLLCDNYGDERTAVVIFDPELEIWIWSDSPHVATSLGWEGRDKELRQFLVSKGYFAGDEAKPRRPKEAMEEALEAAELQKSASRYYDLAQKVSFRRCQDEAFHKFKNTLQCWFCS